MRPQPPPRETAAPARFPYEELLAHYKDELRDGEVQARFNVLIDTDPRCKAHWNSLAYFDLERAAAMQDGKDLEAFTAAQATEFCRRVARTSGEVLSPLLRGEADADGFTRRQWGQHCDGCVYCRRMRRLAHGRHARLALQESGLSPNEPLLRDWLLEEHYLPALEQATQRILASDAAPLV